MMQIILILLGVVGLTRDSIQVSPTRKIVKPTLYAWALFVILYALSASLLPFRPLYVLGYYFVLMVVSLVISTTEPVPVLQEKTFFSFVKVSFRLLLIALMVIVIYMILILSFLFLRDAFFPPKQLTIEEVIRRDKEAIPEGAGPEPMLGVIKLENWF